MSVAVVPEAEAVHASSCKSLVDRSVGFRDDRPGTQIAHFGRYHGGSASLGSEGDYGDSGDTQDVYSGLLHLSREGMVCGGLGQQAGLL